MRPQEPSTRGHGRLVTRPDLASVVLHEDAMAPLLAEEWGGLG